jgi:hypothetical protein
VIARRVRRPAGAGITTRERADGRLDAGITTTRRHDVTTISSEELRVVVSS